MDFVAALMLKAGVLGGAAYCFLNHHPKYPGIPPADRTGNGSLTAGGVAEWVWQMAVSIVLGITAASVVPVFLHATSSNLIDEVREYGVQMQSPPADNLPPTGTDPSGIGTGTQTARSASPRPVKPSAPYVFFGFCVLAAYAAQRFLQAMLNRWLREIEELKAQNRRALAKAEHALQLATDNTVTLRMAGMAPAAAAPRLSDDERRVLESLMRSWRDQRRERATAAVIATEVALPTATVQTALDGLIGKGFVNVQDRDGQREWGLTEAGALFRP